MTNKKEEQGRSTVEMLGVLAIIGVLSVAGIAGYSRAMNKHRANELLNEASKRAAMLAMQITSGRTGALSLAEFVADTGNGSFTAANYTAGADTFTMTLTGVSEDVCTQMKAALGDDTIMAVTGDCGGSLTLTFNKDLKRGVTVSSGGGNNPGQQQTTCSDYPLTTCPTGAECSQCPEDSTKLSLYSCPANTYKNGNECTACEPGKTAPAGSTSASACVATGPLCATAGACTLHGIMYTWDGARDECGGIEHMATLADIGCTTSGCSGAGYEGVKAQLGSDFFVWVSDESSEYSGYYYQVSAYNNTAEVMMPSYPDPSALCK